mmetsp:Transcript_13451/g.42491  ORF Transcript_13451/g.42491 Transcript_13451/m.42491 type:complete len:266 (-) Transcript_13451:114-911(-)
MLRILPRRGRMAWVARSRPCLAEPAAESPSTMKISASALPLAAQSASLPGRTVEARRVLRRTRSRACLAAVAADWAARALSTMAARALGCQSKSLASSSPTTASTIWRTPGEPRRVLVWPSNSGSGTFTTSTAVRPSRTYSPGMFDASALSLPAFLAAALTPRVSVARRPSTWVPPSAVRMPLANETTTSLNWSELQRSAHSTLTPSLTPAASRLAPSAAWSGVFPAHSSSANSPTPPTWRNSRARTFFRLRRSSSSRSRAPAFK